MSTRKEVAQRVVEQAAACDISLVASLPDNWVAEVIREFDRDDRFRHVPVNREESAVGLCSGAFLSGTGSMAVMGASGLMTLIYAITKINYTYEIPLMILATLRGAPGDKAKFHVSNGLYFLPSLDAINLTYEIIDSADKIPLIKRAYDHSRTVSRPVVAIMTRDVLRGGGLIMAIPYRDAFQFLADKRQEELVVTSAGNSSQMWWDVTKDADKTFYLDASMSMSTLLASGVAYGLPQAKVWAFMGDGAFIMNPAMLMVERDLNLSNLVHVLVSNRVYGGTSDLDLPNKPVTDYVAMAKSMGLERCWNFETLGALEDGFDAAFRGNDQGHSFVVLELDPMLAVDRDIEEPPMDGPEIKFRFGRYIEATYGAKVFTHQF